MVSGRAFSKGSQHVARLLTTTAIIAVGTIPVTAQQAPEADRASVAASATYRFNIPAKSLAAAIADVGAASGWRIAYPFTLPTNVRSKPLSGSMTPPQAVGQLLAGTGLSYRVSGAQSIVLVDPKQQAANGGALPAGAIPLDTIDVQGAGNPNSTMTLMPAYAGGQVARGGQLGMLGNKDMMNAPFNQTVYTRKLIESQQAKSLGDVLANDPSVVKRFSDAAGIDTWDIRGLSTNSATSFNGLFGIAPTTGTIMPTESIERVEVLKGANALLNGVAPNQGANLGVINLVPKRAGEQPLIAFTPDYAMNSQFGGHLDLSRRFGDDNAFGVRFNGVYRNGDTPIDNQSRETRLAALGLDYRKDGFRVSADFGYQFQNTVAPRRPISVATGIPMPKAPDNRTNWTQDWAFLQNENRYGVVRAEWDVSEVLTAYAAIGRNETSSSGISDLRTVQDAAGTLTGRILPIDSVIYDNTAEVGLRAQLKTGPVNHAVSLAGAWTLSESGTRLGNKLNLPSTNLYHPAAIAKPGDFGLLNNPRDTPKTTRQESQGLALADTMSILDDRIQLILGLRHQQVHSRSYTSADKYDADALSPAAALIVKPLENVSLYANYMQALEAGQVAPTDAVNAGEIFAPYKTQQYEVGAKVDFGRVAATLAAFTATRPTYTRDPNTFIFGETGKERYQGIEFTAFGEVTGSVRFIGGVTFLDPTLVETPDGRNIGNRTAGQPKYRTTLSMEWDTPLVPGLTLNATGQWQSSTYLDTANLQRVAGWYSVDLGARYTINLPDREPIVLRATVRNVLDANVWVATRNGLSLATPRTFLLSSTFKF